MSFFIVIKYSIYHHTAIPSRAVGPTGFVVGSTEPSTIAAELVPTLYSTEHSLRREALSFRRPLLQRTPKHEEATWAGPVHAALKLPCELPDTHHVTLKVFNIPSFGDASLRFWIKPILKSPRFSVLLT